MSVSREIKKLLMILEEQTEATYQRVTAMQNKNGGQARFIETHVYPNIKKRMLKQISVVDREFMKYEKGEYDEAKKR